MATKKSGMDWLTQLKPGMMDTDLTDEAAWQARPELAAKSKARFAAEAKAMKQKVASDKKGVTAASVTKLDTDHSDEEAWKARQELKKLSKERKAKEAARIAAENAAYRNRVKNTKTSELIDDDLRDEEEWNVRPDLVLAHKARKEREAKDLKFRNKQIRDRLSSIKPMVPITSPHGMSTYEDEKWVKPFVFDSIREGVHQAIIENVMTRTRDKYSDFGMRNQHNDSFNRVWTVSDGFTRAGRDERPPSWLQPANGAYVWSA